MASTSDPIPPTPEDDVERARRQSIIRRVSERIQELGLNARGVSRAIGAGDTYVWELVNDKIRSPSRSRIASIARELQCSVEYLEGDIDSLYPSERGLKANQRVNIPIIGYTEPDTFRKMQSDRQDTILDYPIHPRFPNARHFALQVRGNDMDACKYRGRPAPIFEGMTVVCVDMATAGIAIETGEIYAIERSLDGGKTGERLLRRAEVYADRIELVPQSSESKRPVFTIPREPDRSAEIKVIGLVYSSFYDFVR